MEEKSGLHLFSIGTVAKDKPRESFEIDVVVNEHNHMFNDEIDKTEKEEELTSKNERGTPVPVTSKTSQTIKAIWMSYGNGGNRITAPDVVKGETVQVWRYGDTQDYYWEKQGSEMELRRLERIIEIFGGHLNVGVKNDLKNSYWKLLSTFDKLVQFHTSRENGETHEWDFKLDTARGVFTLTDNAGLTFTYHAVNGTYTAQVENRMLHETKEYVVNAADRIHMQTQNVSINATSHMNISTPILNISKDVRIGGNLAVSGSGKFGGMVTASGFSIGGGGMRMIPFAVVDGQEVAAPPLHDQSSLPDSNNPGSVPLDTTDANYMVGTFRVRGRIEVVGEISATGDISSGSKVSAPQLSGYLPHSH